MNALIETKEPRQLLRSTLLRLILNVINERQYYISHDRNGVHVVLPYRDMTIGEIKGLFNKDYQELLSFHPMTRGSTLAWKGVFVVINMK